MISCDGWGLGRSFVLERACVGKGLKSSKDGKAPWV